jgi:hypothetical protein
MLIRILAMFILSIWGNVTVAKPILEPTLYSIADVRTAIEQNDFVQVEKILAKTHEDLRRGRATPDQFRNRISLFETTDPDTIAFVESWRSRYPNSIYAKTAQAWVYSTIGRNIRGIKFVHETFPLALEIHRNLHFDAHTLALEAFTEDNTLISASDAVLVLANTTGTQDIALRVLDETMTVQPDWGSLNRALWMANPQYGGSLDLAEALCEFFGPMIIKPEVDYERACITRASFLFFGHRRDEIRSWMSETNDTWYDPFRVQDIFRHRPATDEEVALAVNYFKNGTTTDLRLARKFDTYYSWQDGSEPIHEIVLDRAKSWAESRLEHDPYNLAALKVLLTSSHEVTVKPDGSVFYKPTGRPTEIEKRDYLRRRLLASPYNAEFWKEMAQSVSLFDRNTTEQEVHRATAMRINAIAYSNHSHDAVNDLVYQKLSGIEHFAAWEEATGEKSQRALNYNTTYVCPLIRSTRIMEQLIAIGSPKKSYSEMTEETLAQLEEIRAAAEVGGYCHWERNAPLEEIIFEPVEVDLSFAN